MAEGTPAPVPQKKAAFSLTNTCNLSSRTHFISQHLVANEGENSARGAHHNMRGAALEGLLVLLNSHSAKEDSHLNRKNIELIYSNYIVEPNFLLNYIQWIKT